MNKTASLITHYQQSDFKDFVQIQKLFHKRNIVLDYVVLDYIDIDSSIQKVKECAKKDNYLIGDIFTSFYLRYETNSNAKILINPIMKPSDFKYLEKVNLIEKVKKMEEFIDWYRDAEIRATTYAVFENSTFETPSSDAKIFLEQYGKKFDKKYDNYCFSDRVAGIKKALDYFEYFGNKTSQGDLDI